MMLESAIAWAVTFQGHSSTMQTTVMCFGLFLLKEYQNILANDIKYTAFQNSTALGKVRPLPIMEFWNHLESSITIFDSTYIWENPYDSIIGESLQMSIGGSTWEEITCAELETTIGVGAVRIRYGNKFSIHLHMFEKWLDKVNMIVLSPYVPSRCD